MAKLTNTTIYGAANITGNVVSTGYGFDISANGGVVNLSTANSITSITVSNSGAGYQSVPAILIANPTTGGVAANANAIIRFSGTIAVGNVGAGYSNGDYLYANVAGSKSNALFQVTSNTATTYGTGGINGVNLIRAGQYYTIPPGSTGATPYITITGTTGTGVGANLQSLSGIAIDSVEFQNYGSGYVQQPSVTISGGSPTTTSTAYAIIGDSVTIKGLGYSTINQTFMTFKGPNSQSDTFRLGIGNALTPEYVTLENTQYGRSNFYAGGGTNSQLWLGATGSGYINFSTRGTSLITQFRVADTASAINYLQVTGNTIGSGPLISAQGSDTNIDIYLAAKGTGRINVASKMVVGAANVSNFNSTALSDGLVVANNATSGSIGFGGTNGRTLSAYQGSSISNFDMLANQVYYTGDLLVTGKISSPNGATSNLTLTTTAANSTVYIDRTLYLANANTSTSNSTGALIVNGGVGVSGNIYVGGTNAGVNGVYTDVLRYAANGLPWVMSSGGVVGGNVSASGWTTNTILFANATGFLSTVSANLSYYDANNTIRTGGLILSGPVLVQNTTPSTSNTTGSLVVSGGVGVSGNVFVGSVYANTGFQLGYAADGVSPIQGTFKWSGPNVSPAWFGIYDSTSSRYYGISSSLPGSIASVGGYYSGMGISGTTSSAGSPIFGVLNNTQSGNGLGNTAFTIYGDSKVITLRNTLDDNRGNANVTGNLTVGNSTSSISSTSNTTGSLVVSGGVGVSGNVYISNTISILTDSAGLTNRPITIQGGQSGTFGARIGVAEALDFYTINFPIYFATSGARTSTQFVVNATASAVNYLQASGNTTGGGVVLSAAGSDTNIGINITPKGSGSVNITSTAVTTSNTTGSLVVSGGIGVTGNVYLSAANNFGVTSSSFGSYRLGWSDNYLYRSGQFNGMEFSGTYFSIKQGQFFVEANVPATVRSFINNDSGNNTVIFYAGSPVLVQNTAAAVSNTTGSLVVSGGVGVTGNVYLSAANNFNASTGSNSYRLGWTDNFFERDAVNGGMLFRGSFLNAQNNLFASGVFYARSYIANDTANGVVIFGGASPVLHQNTAAAVSNSTGSLIVNGGIGTSGAIYSTGGSITINNGLATTGNSGTIFLGDGSFTKTYGGSWTFGGGVRSTGAGFTADGVPGISYTGYVFSGTGQAIYQPSTGVVGVLANSANAFMVSTPVSSVNYLQVSGNTTGNAPTLSAQGSDANVNMNIVSSGNTSIIQGANNFVTFGGMPGNEVVRIYRNNSITGGYFNTGASTPPAFSFIPPQSNFGAAVINLGLNPRINSLGSDGYYLQTNTSEGYNGSAQLKIAHTGSTVNYLSVSGSIAGNSATMTTLGSDANVAMSFLPKGTGAFNISTANGVNLSSGNTTVTGLSISNNGSNYTSFPTLTISPPTTSSGITATGSVANMNFSAGAPTVVNGGTGYSLNDVLTIVGGTPVSSAGTLTVTGISANVITSVTYTAYNTYSVLPSNPVSVTGGTGTSATFNLLWKPNFLSITNPGSGYVEQPTVSFSGGSGSGVTAYASVGSSTLIKSLSSSMSFYTPGGEFLRLQENNNGTFFQPLQIIRDNSSNVTKLSGVGQNLRLEATNSGGVITLGGISGDTSLRVSPLSSAVNYVNITGNTAGGPVVISSQGSDTNIGINIIPKGNGSANIVSTANSTSNTTGALVVTGGMGITGNVFLSSANNFFSTTTGASYRLGWPDNHFYRDERYGGINFSGGYLNMASTFITSAALSIRGTVVNDAGNNVVVFAGSSPVLLQNTTPSTSNITGALVVAGGVGVKGNVATDGIIFADGTRQITAGSSIANTVYLQGVNDSQNARMVIIEGTNSSQNVRLDYSNTAITIIQGVDVGQNNRMTIIEGVDVTQNTNIANKLNLTGSLNQTVSGNVTISQDLIVSGNLIITGNIASQNVQQLAVADPLIILGIGNYVSDTKDIGFAGHYNDGTNAHAGLIRDSGTKEFYVFQGYTPELDSNNNVIITDPTFTTANLNANYVKSNLVATTVVVNGIDLSTYTQATYAQANVTIGVDTSQNARMTIIEATDVSQNSRMTIIEGTNASQNVRLDYSNTAITIIQGVDVTQNTRLTVIEGTDVSQNARMTIIEGTDTAQNTRMTVIEGTDASQNVRLDYSNTAITIIQGVDVAQNTSISATDGKMQSAYNTANNAVANIGPVITTNTTAQVIIANTAASTSNTTGSLVVKGGLGVAGNISASGIISTNYQGGGLTAAQNAAMQISGANTKGGTGYFDFLWANNTYSTSNSLFFRISPSSNLEIINGIYTTKILDLSQSGTLNVTNMFVTTGSGAIYADSIRYSANGSPWSFGGGSIAITNDTTNSTTLFPLLTSANSGTFSSANTSNTKLYYVPSTGTLNATIFNSLSDVKYKENIITIVDAVNTVNQIDGVSFSWKDNGLKSYGVIANELEKILPELVTTENDTKSVNYSGLIAFLINSVKELDARVKQLENR